MVLVGAAHHRALMHSGVAADDILDHGGEDFEAVVADDHPLVDMKGTYKGAVEVSYYRGKEIATFPDGIAVSKDCLLYTSRCV